MRLFLTRDETKTARTLIWVSDVPPMMAGDMWACAGLAIGFHDTEYECAPGTCTELFTEQQVRMRVAKAYADAGEGLVFAWADAYLETPTDSNWARLMAEVGANA